MTGDSDGLALDLERVLPAPPERVFEACVETDQLADWWGACRGSPSSSSTSTFAWAAYRIAMQPPDGDAFRVGGAFRELSPPRRLVYTFAYEEPDPDDRETVVTLSLLEHPHGTRLVLRQAPFATEARRALHETGWKARSRATATAGFPTRADGLAGECSPGEPARFACRRPGP